MAGLILGLVNFLWGVISFWTRREKLKIRVTSPSYAIDGIHRQIRVYLGIEFRRSGGADIRYISRVILKPDQETYSQLGQYFNLPSDGIIRYDTRIELPRDKVMSSFNNIVHRTTYKALPEIKNAKDRDKATQIARQLKQKTCKIGLVWEDNDKTIWKTVSPDNFMNWV